ncbi:conserved hypothetical protein [Lebetimonas natsushimae]|uniref:Uncharacterized protein n=1 Tax=Lebetimonas natsushimae TaxID=1936991 RepID=A0A292YAD8_9BACT|nr:hypothetical protein [Lebetimonas natsushimae]GAX87017.1 conserved hypothetical protein [Lebetimonas natsushimae]
MFNLKKMPFTNKLKNKELNYSLKLLDRYEYPPEIEKLVHEFINTTSHSELQKFVDSQNIFSFSTNIDLTENFDVLKEKMAYELNEQLLKLAFLI